MSRGLQYGFTRGYWNALGPQIDLALQIAIVAAGVSTLLATSVLAFSLIKWFSVTYLVYLMARRWQAPPQALNTDGERPLGRPLTLVLRGFLVNTSNPKVIIFILAMPSQFIDPHQPLLAQYLITGDTITVVDLIIMAGYTGLVARVLRVLRSPRQQKLVNRTFTSLSVGATGLLATVHRAPL